MKFIIALAIFIVCIIWVLHGENKGTSRLPKRN